MVCLALMCFHTFHGLSSTVWYAGWGLGFYLMLVVQTLVGARGLQARVRVDETAIIGHDVVRLRVDRPAGWMNEQQHAGSVVRLCVPELSGVEFHDFTLTSTPHDDYLEMIIVPQGGSSWTQRLARMVHRHHAGDSDEGDASTTATATATATASALAATSTFASIRNRGGVYHFASPPGRRRMPATRALFHSVQVQPTAVAREVDADVDAGVDADADADADANANADADARVREPSRLPMYVVIEGPLGSATSHFNEFQAVLLVGARSGFTPVRTHTRQRGLPNVGTHLMSSVVPVFGVCCVQQAASVLREMKYGHHDLVMVRAIWLQHTVDDCSWLRDQLDAITVADLAKVNRGSEVNAGPHSTHVSVHTYLTRTPKPRRYDDAVEVLDIIQVSAFSTTSNHETYAHLHA